MTNIDEIRSLPVEQAALLADLYLREVENDYHLTFACLGEVVLAARDRQLWRYAPSSPKDFTSWLTDCLPVSHGTAFSALRCAEKLTDIPFSERRRIPRGNQERLAKMSPALVRNDLGLRQSALKLNPSAFADYVEREFPYEHVPSDTIMRFRVSGEARAKVDEALKGMMQIYECSRDEAFVFLCEQYLLDKSNVPKA